MKEINWIRFYFVVRNGRMMSSRYLISADENNIPVLIILFGVNRETLNRLKEFLNIKKVFIFDSLIETKLNLNSFSKNLSSIDYTYGRNIVIGSRQLIDPSTVRAIYKNYIK